MLAPPSPRNRTKSDSLYRACGRVTHERRPGLHYPTAGYKYKVEAHMANTSISLIGVAASIKDYATLGKIIGSLFCECESPEHVVEDLHVLIREFRELSGRENYVECWARWQRR